MGIVELKGTVTEDSVTHVTTSEYEQLMVKLSGIENRLSELEAKDEH